MGEDIKKILIRGVNWVGDAVLTIPAINAIRHTYPDAHICLLVKPWVAGLFEESPDVDEIMLYDGSYSGLFGKLKLAQDLRKKKFDQAILLQNAFDAALITWLAGIPKRIGYSRDGREMLLTTAIPVENATVKKHQVFYYLDMLKTAGISRSEIHPYIRITDEETDKAKGLVKNSLKSLSSSNRSDGLIIGINPGAAYGSAKRWLPESFAEVIRKIIDELDGNIILFGGPAEVEIAADIVKELGTQNAEYSKRLVNISGKTSLRELAALITECDVFISNDSGPMHMASALFVPVVAIFGSTDNIATGPFGDGHRIVTKGLPCSPCLKRECPEGHLKCMTEITSEDVFNEVQKAIPSEKAVFFDKDGTLIEDKNYLNNFDDMELLPDTKEVLAELKDAGYKLIGITNQSGIARGIVDESFVKESNAHLKEQLGMDDFYYCPHHPDEGCACRKPAPLMILKAKLKHGIDLKSSYMIGDKESDVLLGRESGITGILLSQETPEETKASHVASNLKSAANWIMNRKA